MTKIKLCGLTSVKDIEAVNDIRPDYAGFVFAEKSRRYVSPERAKELKRMLAPAVNAVGVFVDEKPETAAALLRDSVIDLAQLHGNEDEAYIQTLRSMTGKPIIQAFVIRSAEDVCRAEASCADFILLDGGKGDGAVFDWSLLKHIKRPYFLAGGLTPEIVGTAVKSLRPFAVDVSTGIETGGKKDREKMNAFVNAVRKEDRHA